MRVAVSIRAVTTAVLFSFTALPGCSHVPLATIAKLITFDASTADPAVLRAAVRLPPSLVPRPLGVVLTVEMNKAGGRPPEKLDLVLLEVRDADELKPLALFRRDGTQLHAFRLSEEDIARVRRLQADSRANGVTGGKIAVGAKACRNGDLPKGPILTSSYLRLDLANGYMPLIEDFDLRAELTAADLDKEVPPC